MEVPAHTAGHIAYYLPSEEIVFVGDTLFAMGCGRLFEGEAAQMHANLPRLERLPEEAKVYCAHEYTLPTGRFELPVAPHTEAPRPRIVGVVAMRAAGKAHVPNPL